MCRWRGLTNSTRKFDRSTITVQENRFDERLAWKKSRFVDLERSWMKRSENDSLCEYNLEIRNHSLFYAFLPYSINATLFLTSCCSICVQSHRNTRMRQHRFLFNVTSKHRCSSYSDSALNLDSLFSAIRLKIFFTKLSPIYQCWCGRLISLSLSLWVLSIHENLRVFLTIEGEKEEPRRSCNITAEMSQKKVWSLERWSSSKKRLPLCLDDKKFFRWRLPLSFVVIVCYYANYYIVSKEMSPVDAFHRLFK